MISVVGTTSWAVKKVVNCFYDGNITEHLNGTIIGECAPGIDVAVNVTKVVFDPNPVSKGVAGIKLGIAVWTGLSVGGFLAGSLVCPVGTMVTGPTIYALNYVEKCVKIWWD